MTSRFLFGLIVPGFFALLLAGCESTSLNAPPITPSLIRAGTREQADIGMLTEGRSVFLNRCIQCHALPETAKYSPDRLREIVAMMSGRANLSARQREALLKYLLAARSL
jgi:mono/diheme cytochrome c family protein